MLADAFVETAEYKALTTTTDFHFVVGRRGTGKSALFNRVSLHFWSVGKSTKCHAEVPKEHDAINVHGILKNAGCDYRQARALCRLAWRAYIANVVGATLVGHYKAERCDEAPWLRDHLSVWGSAIASGAYAFIANVLTRCDLSSLHAAPAQLAAIIEVEKLERSVIACLSEVGSQAVVLFDGLDEGWEPGETQTALLGGLTLAATDLRDRDARIHVIVFIRDNMHRSLAHFDPDFSRHVEGADLRLRWDVDSMLHLVAQRLRVALGVNYEADIKVWNRFAKTGLEGRAGFEHCLRFTLYRPRDVLSLLNRAEHHAASQQRTELVLADVDDAAVSISKERLDDLCKEYSQVLPGLPRMIAAFRGGQRSMSYTAAAELLDAALARETYADDAASDFALLNSAREIFFALFSIGFLGSEDRALGRYLFCHDGDQGASIPDASDTKVAVHPCYWRALTLQGDESVDVIIEVNDEYEPERSPEIQDLRLQMLGQIVEQLPTLKEGSEHAARLEEWVLRAVRLLFSGSLSNVEHHPNKDAVSRRDVVATNVAERGFWKRVYDDYGARQVVFEVKNYLQLKPNDFNQCLAYAGGTFGRITFVVTRAEHEGLGDNERSHVQELERKNHRVLIIPAKLLQQFVRKQRSKKRADYWEHALSKLLDTYERRYIQVTAGRSKKSKRDRTPTIDMTGDDSE